MEFSSKGRMLSPGGQRNDFIKLEVKNAAHHFALHMPLNPQAQKGVTVQAGVIDPDY